MNKDQTKPPKTEGCVFCEKILILGLKLNPEHEDVKKLITTEEWTVTNRETQFCNEKNCSNHYHPEAPEAQKGEELDKKVVEGMDKVLNEHGEVFKKLGEYDRGEEKDGGKEVRPCGCTVNPCKHTYSFDYSIDYSSKNWNPPEERASTDWECWEKWKQNFCQHISDWSYLSADEELERMKRQLLKDERAKWEQEPERKKGESRRRGYMRGIEEEKTRAIKILEGLTLPPPKTLHEPECIECKESKAYNAALEDIKTKLKE